jgi:hypothetical protein
MGQSYSKESSVDSSACYRGCLHDPSEWQDLVVLLCNAFSSSSSVAVELHRPYPTLGQHCTFRENHIFHWCKCPLRTALIHFCAFSCIIAMLAVLLLSGDVIAPSVFQHGILSYDLSIPTSVWQGYCDPQIVPCRVFGISPFSIAPLKPDDRIEAFVWLQDPSCRY